MLASVMFYIFAAVLLACATVVITARNAVHAVLFLILGFFNAAGLFLLAGAEFLAMILVVVYVGAVAVLFLFVVMMLDISVTRVREGVQKYWAIGAVIGVVLFAELIAAFGAYHIDPALAALRVSPTPTGVANTDALGALIYTQYVLLFQLSGLILLVAMMGAIVLTLRNKPDARRQSIAAQTGRRVEDTLVMVPMKLGQAVNEVGIFRPLTAEPAVPLLPMGATNPDVPILPATIGEDA